MKKRILFIINPISGTKQKQLIPEEIAASLDTSHFDYNVHFTSYAGHAAEMARDAATDGVDIVVAVGGDGTVNEVARSLVHTRTALGIIPFGSGNGLARHLQIPQSPQRAIEIINADVVHCLDYGRINDIPFFCTCGMGFDAFVCHKFSESGKRGLMQYAKNTIGSGLTYKPEVYTISSNGQTIEMEAFLIACANASQYGNNAYIAPTASMKDGLMDVVVMKPFPTIEGPQVLFQMFTKTIYSNAYVSMFQCNKVHITRSAPGPVHCDGEPLMMGTEIDVELIKRSFNVVVNPEAHRKKKNALQEIGDRLEELLGLDVLRPHQHEEQVTNNESASTTIAKVGKSYNEADPYDLQRFVDAQKNTYRTALEEVRNGRKRTHWMWYIFPQMRDLGSSPTSQRYGITCRLEAEQYLLHPVLGPRLLEISEELMRMDEKLTIYDVFGHPDDRKLCSCMTLFDTISTNCDVFRQVLARYYKGQPDQLTLRLLGE